MIQFIRLTAANCAAASFLDRRLLNPGVPTAPVPWADLAAAENLTSAMSFHLPHLSRRLDVVIAPGRSLPVFALVSRAGDSSPGLADIHRMLDQPECSWSRRNSAIGCGHFWPSGHELTNQTKSRSSRQRVSCPKCPSTSWTGLPTARSIFTYVSPLIFLKALSGGAMSDIDSGIEKRHWFGLNVDSVARVGGGRFIPGERVALGWLTEMSAMHAAGHRYPDRVLWMDFDQFLEMPVVGLTAALSLFGVGDATDAAGHNPDRPHHAAIRQGAGPGV